MDKTLPDAAPAVIIGMSTLSHLARRCVPAMLLERRRIACGTTGHAARMGIASRILSPAEVGERWPGIVTDDVRARLRVPSNGQLNPLDMTMALAKGARQRGRQVFEGARRGAGAPHGQRHMGMFATNARRLEKGFCPFGHDIA